MTNAVEVGSWELQELGKFHRVVHVPATLTLGKPAARD